MKVNIGYDRNGEIVKIGNTVKVEIPEECHLITNGLISKVYGIEKHRFFIGGGSVDDGDESEYRTQYDFILHYPDKNKPNGYREVTEPFYSCKKID